jgi:hypothetical protein
MPNYATDICKEKAFMNQLAAFFANILIFARKRVLYSCRGLCKISAE